MKPSRAPNAPDHLRAPTQAWFLQVLDAYQLEPHHIHLLTLAAEALDRAEQARAILAEEGLIYWDRAGRPCPRPEVAIERDSRLAFARLVRELDLDVESAAPATRPPPLRSNRRP